MVILPRTPPAGESGHLEAQSVQRRWKAAARRERRRHAREAAAAVHAGESGAAPGLLAAPLILVLGPLGLVMAFRALGDGCLRIGVALGALGGWFLLSGLMLAVPGAVGRWLCAVWLALVVTFIAVAAAGPTPMTCPAW